MSKNTELFGLILAGGSGSRLWPLSREMYPKQLLKLNQENTFFQSTFLRLANIIPDTNIITVTNVKHATDIKMQLNDLQKKFNRNENYKVITEPVGRNTAPAIALSVYFIQKQIDNGQDPVILVAPSDHLVKDINKFSEAINEGIKLAKEGYIVTFGIKPEKPDTGYGYIYTENDETISNLANTGFKVKEFKEKPDFETAKQYCDSGKYFWNSGIFMFKASTILKEFNSYASNILKDLENIELSSTIPTVKFDDYIKVQDISIDYAVMEHSKNIALLPIDCGWNDVGSWEAIFEISEKDKNNNFISGNVIDIDSKNSMVYSTSKLVSSIGLDNVVIVETEDAILACDKNRTQDVKKVFESLKQSNSEACMTHTTVYRPWGYYTVLQKGKGFLIKIIEVNPKAKLSLQMHNHRSEHWVVLSGYAKVIRGEEIVYLQSGDSVDIPVQAKHSLQNEGDIPLKIIEVQKGDILEENDIIRFEDIYGRVN